MTKKKTIPKKKEASKNGSKVVEMPNGQQQKSISIAANDLIDLGKVTAGSIWVIMECIKKAPVSFKTASPLLDFFNGKIATHVKAMEREKVTGKRT